MNGGIAIAFAHGHEKHEKRERKEPNLVGEEGSPTGQDFIDSRQGHKGHEQKRWQGVWRRINQGAGEGAGETGLLAVRPDDAEAANEFAEGGAVAAFEKGKVEDVPGKEREPKKRGGKGPLPNHFVQRIE